MRQLLLLTTLLLSSQLFTQAQETQWCGTPATASKWTENYLSNRTAFEKSDEILYVPVTVHVVGTDAGEGYASFKSILDAFCTLNADFATSNVIFYLQGNIRYIKNSRFYNHTSSNTGRTFARQNNISNTINTYIVENAGGAAGYVGDISSDYLVIKKAEFTSGNHTWGHEMGHALGLYHTFFGWETYVHDYSQNAPSVVNNNRAVERVDASNCKNAGDGLCDTSPDYLKDRWDCNTNTENIIQRDPIGQTFRSDGTNIMSYATDNCTNRFSEEQKAVMRANLKSTKVFFLSSAQPLPSLDTLQVEAIAPATGAAVDAAAVELEWTKLPVGTNYLVEVSIYPNFVVSATDTYFSQTNKLTLTGLTKNKSYYWRVRPYNINSTCSNFSKSSRFRTSLTTATEELQTDIDLAVFPNPAAAGQTFTISANLPERNRLNIRLFDLAGKLITSATYDALAGENQLPFVPGELSKGIYILHVTSDHINAVKKVIIQ